MTAIEADERHVREILKDLELERANHSATPCAVERKDEGGARRDESEGKNRCDQGLRPSTSGTPSVTVTTGTDADGR